MNTDYSIKLLSDEARSQYGKIVESILKHADINKLKGRIHIFQNMDIQNLSDKELETNLKSGDPFVLCIYEAIKPLRFSWIGGKANYDFNGIKNKKAIEFLETIRQFLVDEFTQIIPEGQESLYRMKRILMK